jgi:hypothetical protein
MVLAVEPWLSADKHPVSLTCATLSPDGRRLAVGGGDGAVVLFDLPSAKKLWQLCCHDGPVTSLVFAANGKTLHSSDLNAYVATWDVAAGTLPRQQAKPGSAKKGTRWSLNEDYWGSFWLTHEKEGWERWWNSPMLAAEGRWLVVANDQGIGVRDLSSGKTRILEIPGYHDRKATLSQDGRLLLVSHEDLVRLVDVASGMEVRAFGNFEDHKDCCLSADGKLMAACGAKGVRLWDTATGTLLAEFYGHRGQVTAVAFSADGRTLVSAAWDGSLLVWDVGALCARPETKALTAAELQTMWDDLAALDAPTASAAMHRLAAHPQQAVLLFRDKLKPVVASKEAIARWVADLDDARPKVREQAAKELRHLAELAEPALDTCLAGKPSLEQRRRVELLLARLREPIVDGDKLRGLRAVEVLAWLATPDAADFLRLLASGADSAYVTREAQAALHRLRWTLSNSGPKK